MKAPRKTPRKAIAKRITKIRGDRSQRGWAREMGVFQQNIHRYEAAQAVPHADFLILLGRCEGISLDWLLLGKGKMRREE